MPTKLFQRFIVCLLVLVTVLSPVVATAQNGLIPLKTPSPSGSFLAGQQAARDLRAEEASRFFLDASESDWENPAIVERAFTTLVASGAIDDAAVIAQHLIELEPANETARLLLGTVALKERRYSSAIKHMDLLGLDSFVGITGNIVKAWALIGSENYDAANNVMDELAETGLDEFLVFHRALMADVQGDRELAIAYARQSYESDPFVARIVEGYVRMLGNASRFDEARNALDAYANEGITHPKVTAIIDDIEKGLRPGKLAENPQKGAAEMFHGIGVALARDGALDVSVNFLRMGLFLDPQSDLLSVALAQIFEGAGRFEAANDIYTNLPDSSPMKPVALVRVAQNYDALGDRDEAVRRLKNITAAQPGNGEAILALGDLYRYDEQFEASAEAYTKTLELAGGDHPRDWRYYYLRGIAYERSDQWEKAEVDFLKALDLNPGQPQVLNYLGYSWVDKGLNLKRALGMIQEAVSVNPNDGYIVDSLGWAYYRLDRLDDAVRTLEQAAQLNPNDPEINDHLGDAYWRVGRKLEARFQWNIASGADQDSEAAKRAAEKLIHGLDAVPE